MQKRGIFFAVPSVFLALVFAPLFLNAEEFAPGYPEFDQMLGEIQKLKDDHPELVDLEAYGKSVEDRPLLAIHIFRKDGEARPAAMISANIHGNEMAGNRMAMAIAQRLLEGAVSDPWVKGLLDKMDFWILPCLNPDGYFHTAELYREGDLSGHRKNANDVDLNRNFLLPGPRTLKLSWAGSPKKHKPTYYGPYPLSEPEAQAVKAFMDNHPVFASVNFHGASGALFPARCKSRSCAKDHREMGEAFHKHQEKVKYDYVRGPRLFDSFTGEMEDMQYHFYGALAIDIEISEADRNRSAARKELGDKSGPEKVKVKKEGFWAANPINLDFWIENDRDATLYALEEAYNLTKGTPIPIDER